MLNHSKIFYLLATRDVSMALLPSHIPRVRDSLVFLGSPLGLALFVTPNSRVEELSHILSILPNLQNSQLEITLLRSFSLRFLVPTQQLQQRVKVIPKLGWNETWRLT